MIRNAAYDIPQTGLVCVRYEYLAEVTLHHHPYQGRHTSCIQFVEKIIEQQYRLLHCGAKHPVYVVEGGLRTQDVLPADSLQTSIMATVVSRDIYVYQSSSIDDTIVFLKILQEILKSAVRLYFEKGDECVFGVLVTSSSCFHPLKISFSDFQSLYSKAKESKLKHLWCKQLRQVWI